MEPYAPLDTSAADARLKSMLASTSPAAAQTQMLPQTPYSSVAQSLAPQEPAGISGLGSGLASIGRYLTSPLERPVTDELGYTHYGGKEVPPAGRPATTGEQLKTLGDYAGMTLAGRGGMVYDPEPFRKLAASETARARQMPHVYRRTFGEQPSFEETPFGTRHHAARATRGAAGGQPVDFRQTPLKFSEPAKVKMRGPEHRGDLSTAQEVVQIHADIPGRGAVKIGEIRYTVRSPGPPTAAPGPGSRWAHITHVERQPNVSLHPDELAHIRDAFDQFMRTKGMNAPSTFDYLAMPEMGSAGRLFNWRMNWPQ